MAGVVELVDTSWIPHHPIAAGGLGGVKAIQNNRRPGSSPGPGHIKYVWGMVRRHGWPPWSCHSNLFRGITDDMEGGAIKRLDILAVYNGVSPW